MPDLSKEVAARLTSQFRPSLTCRHNSNVIYTLPQLTDLRVDCWPQALQREKTNRMGPDRTVTMSIAIQQRAPDQERMDLLTNMADDMLDWLLKSGRWAGGAFLCLDGGFSGTDVFDRLRKYEENVFQAIMLVNFKNFT